MIDRDAFEEAIELIRWKRSSLRLEAEVDPGAHSAAAGFFVYRINEDLLHVYIALNSDGETTEHKLIYNRNDG